MPRTDPNKYIQNHRYPIAEPESVEYQDLIHHCQKELTRNGTCVLKNFLRPDALKSFVEEAKELAPRGHHSKPVGNVYHDQSW